MEVWIVEGAETSYRFSEDTYDVVGVYASEELARAASDQYMQDYPKGDTYISCHEVQGDDPQ